MKIRILFWVCLISLLCSNFNGNAQINGGQLFIEELEFPDTLVIGDVHLLSGIVTNISNQPVLFDFNFGIDFDDIFPGNDFDYEYEELAPCDDCDLQPGESKSFSRPVYLSNERVTPNQENVIIVWPSEAVGEDPSIGSTRSRSFYVQDDSAENERNVGFEDCNTISIEQLEDVIKISGLFNADQSNISIVNQFHEVIYFCNNDCPNNEITVDISDGGYYLVQVNLIDGFNYCFDTDMIFTENWLNYENYLLENDFPSYDLLDSVFELPNIAYDSTAGFIYGTTEFIDNLLNNIFNNPFFPIFNGQESPSLLKVPNQYLGLGCGIEVIIENDEFKFNTPLEGSLSILLKNALDEVVFQCEGQTCLGNEIIIQLPDLEEMKYSVDVSYTNNNQVCNNSISMDGGLMFDEWNNLFDICSNQNLLQAPVINNIFQQSALAFIPGFFNDGSLQIKKEDADEWLTIKRSTATYLLSQLNVCTSYDVRAAYLCNNTELYSEIQTFTTQGCVECNIDDIDMKITTVLGNTAIINWDIFSGVNYRLHYKKQVDVEWTYYETPIPFALLFNLDPCEVYQFYLEVICADGIVSTPGKVIEMETGNCRNANLLNEKTEIGIYPNIAKDFINIAVSNTKNLSNIQIYNQAGALIQQIDGSELINNTYQLNINDFAKGMYMVQANAFDNVHYSKFMKQ